MLLCTSQTYKTFSLSVSQLMSYTHHSPNSTIQIAVQNITDDLSCWVPVWRDEVHPQSPPGLLIRWERH